jgi:hypothetical protein
MGIVYLLFYDESSLALDRGKPDVMWKGNIYSLLPSRRLP